MAMSYERMLKTEAQLEAQIAALLRKAELIDAQEDARYGKGKRGDELPKELQLRQDRLDALRKARAELEGEAAADNARRREQQAHAAEEQAAEAAAQAAKSEAAAQDVAKEAQPPVPGPAVPGDRRLRPGPPGVLVKVEGMENAVKAGLEVAQHGAYQERSPLGVLL
jgi:hypothetical protein